MLQNLTILPWYSKITFIASFPLNSNYSFSYRKVAQSWLKQNLNSFLTKTLTTALQFEVREKTSLLYLDIWIQWLLIVSWLVIRTWLECDWSSKHQRLWFFPGELLSAKVTVAGSGLVDWPLQTQLPVKEVNITLLYFYRITLQPWGFSCEQLHLLHNDPGPQVKVLLYYLQQLVLVPVRWAVVKHRDGEWVAHTDRIGDLKGRTDTDAFSHQEI